MNGGQGNRYAGLQLSPHDPSTVLCYCGLTVGRYGISRRCTGRCPGSDDDTQVCGNQLVNTVIYVYRGTQRHPRVLTVYLQFTVRSVSYIMSRSKSKTVDDGITNRFLIREKNSIVLYCYRAY